MSTVNFLALPRPELPRADVSFTVGDQSVTLTLQRLDAYGMMRALERAASFAEEYHQNWFPFPSGQVYEVTPSIARSLAIVEAMQAQPEPFPIAQVFGLMINLPDAWGQVMDAASRLNGGEESEPDEGNA